MTFVMLNEFSKWKATLMARVQGETQLVGFSGTPQLPLTKILLPLQHLLEILSK